VNGAPDGIPEANGDLRKIYGNEIIAKLPHDIIAGRLPIQNLHERGPVLCSASIASVCKSLVAVAVLLLSGSVGSTQEKAPIHVVIQATSEQIKKAAMAMFGRQGYTVDSDVALIECNPCRPGTVLKISKPFSDDETAAYNTAHWTNQPVANCRHVQEFLLSAADEGTSVMMTPGMVCHTDGMWLIRRDGDQKETQWTQNILADLKAKIEETNKRTRR